MHGPSSPAHSENSTASLNQSASIDNISNSGTILSTRLRSPCSPGETDVPEKNENAPAIDDSSSSSMEDNPTSSLSPQNPAAQGKLTNQKSEKILKSTEVKQQDVESNR